jgi:hypothetical protein
MSKLTNQATIKDWLAETRDIQITAYPINQSSHTASSMRMVFENALLQVSKSNQPKVRTDVSATILASEDVLRRDWDTPDEDAAWEHL